MTKATLRRIKVSRPESLEQARTFTKYRNVYSSKGLCDHCAAQAAYGHQHGFHQVHPPCEDCYDLVLTFPHRTSAQAWRKHDMRSL